MESRLDRLRNRRKLAIIRFLKSIILIILIVILSFLLIRVNETITELNVLENTDLFIIDVDKRALTLFGKTYIINF